VPNSGSTTRMGRFAAGTELWQPTAKNPVPAPNRVLTPFRPPLKMEQRFSVREVLRSCLLTGTTPLRVHLRELIAGRAVNILR